MNKTLMLTAALTAAVVSAQTAPETLIQNATVITVTKGTIENGSVLMRGGKIAAVGRAGEVKASPSARVVDATGKFVFPGIIDTHSHSAVEGSVNEGALPNT